MNEPMSKVRLLTELSATRTQWDLLLNTLDSAKMTESRIVGDWSIKDVIFHVTSYADLIVLALEAHLRGEPPPPEVLARPPIDERNAEHVRQSERRTSAQVLEESRQVFDRLIELVEAHPETFLIEPQHFEGMPEPIRVWKNLLHVCDHYHAHQRDIDAEKEKFK